MVLGSIAEAGQVCMAHCSYGTHFAGSRDIYGSFVYKDPNTGVLFQPVLFGEVKEIVSPAANANQIDSLRYQGYQGSPTAMITLGLPICAGHDVNTFFWNQLAELSFSMRCESADNDCLLPSLPDQDYIVTRVLPLQIQFPSIYPRPEDPPLSPRIPMSDFHAASSSMTVPARASKEVVEDVEMDTELDLELDLENFTSDSGPFDWSSLSVGDILVVMGKMVTASETRAITVYHRSQHRNLNCDFAGTESGGSTCGISKNAVKILPFQTQFTAFFLELLPVSAGLVLCLL
ncbi:hypothetical protein B0H10DRAFT_1966609 [Mycena sp. CBHHK59/15]|nr:hypothetical protein B0H10DRAFT_1966609 [Mycena sp. CBHHK59/15]